MTHLKKTTRHIDTSVRSLTLYSRQNMRMLPLQDVVELVFFVEIGIELLPSAKLLFTDIESMTLNHVPESTVSDILL